MYSVWSNTIMIFSSNFSSILLIEDSIGILCRLQKSAESGSLLSAHPQTNTADCPLKIKKDNFTYEFYGLSACFLVVFALVPGEKKCSAKTYYRKRPI